LIVRALLLALLLLAGCSDRHADVHETRFMMGTLVEFTISDADASQARQAIARASREMMRIERLFTIYGAHDNAVKRFNRAPSDVPQRLPDEIDRLLQRALAVQRASRGAFDPALGALDLLWGFSREPAPKRPPSPARIQATKPAPHCLTRDGEGRWVRHGHNCQLDFGGIAKGYALDRGIALLAQAGIRHAIINAGGDMRILGDHHGRPWRIGIRHPRKANQVLGYVALRGPISIVTSGDYERFFVYQGRRYHHILDPRSGMPAGKAQSATVLHARAALADAWSTALFVLGADGLALLQRQGMPALVVDAAGRLHMNTAMRGRFHAIAP